MSETKVLIVDDDVMLIYALKRRLRAAGYATIYAVDALTAIEAAQAESPDVIILDLGMACRDGFWLMQELKASPSTAAMPVIVLTGRDSQEDRDRALKAGAADFLEKPADEARLLKSIKSVLM